MLLPRPCVLSVAAWLRLRGRGDAPGDSTWAGQSWPCSQSEPRRVRASCRAPGAPGQAARAGASGPAAPGGVYVRRRLAALGLEGLLLAVRTLSVTRLRFRLSAPSLAPRSEEFLSLSLPAFSVAFPKLPEDEKTGRQNHLAENRISRILFHPPVQSQSPVPICTTRFS